MSRFSSACMPSFNALGGWFYTMTGTGGWVWVWVGGWGSDSKANPRRLELELDWVSQFRHRKRYQNSIVTAQPNLNLT